MSETNGGRKKKKRIKREDVNPELYRRFEPLGVKELRHASTYNRSEYHSHIGAVEFYENKLTKLPDMPRYHQCLGALKAVEGDFAASEYHYAASLSSKPNDIMVRNDYALQLARAGKLNEANDEIRKALIRNPEQPTLRKNLAAILGRRGDYQGALEHSRRALELNPLDPMNHRNIAKILSASGDTISALSHNRRSMEIESHGHHHTPAAFRAAAVQIISTGGDKNDAIPLMRRARELEGKKMILPTSVRTYEIIAAIQKRQGNKVDILLKEEKEKEDLKARTEAIKSGNALSILEQEKKLRDEAHREEKARGY